MFLGETSPILVLIRRWLGVAMCAVVAVAFVHPGAALASSAVSTTFGTQPIGAAGNGAPAPTSLSIGVAAGVNVVRYGFETMTLVSGGFSQDSIVKFFAQQGDAVLPVLGLPCDTSGCASTWSPSPSEAALKMSSLVTQVAERYGVNGTFWKDNPSVSYHPIAEFEIGNEENLFKEWVVDATHLHWAPQSHTQPDTQGPADYAQVYEATRTALHAVDPTGIALVGGLADSANLNVDVQSDERYIAALTPGTVDAVGYHDWVFDVSTASMTTDQFTALEEQDPAALRSWMEANGYSGVPISITEIDACNQTPGTSVDSNCAVNHTSAQWGPVAANFVEWATCTPGMDINNIEGFWWGDTPSTASNGWLPLLDINGTPTVYGQDFMAMTKALTTNGCPRPVSRGKTAAPKLSMKIRIVKVVRKGGSVTVTVRFARRSGTLSATAVEVVKKHHKAPYRRLKSHRKNATTMTFTGRLPLGRWVLSITGKPASGYAKPKAARRTVRIIR